jgi:hypothetical protein
MTCPRINTSTTCHMRDREIPATIPHIICLVSYWLSVVGHSRALPVLLDYKVYQCLMLVSSVLCYWVVLTWYLSPNNDSHIGLSSPITLPTKQLHCPVQAMVAHISYDWEKPWIQRLRLVIIKDLIMDLNTCTEG